MDTSFENDPQITALIEQLIVLQNELLAARMLFEPESIETSDQNEQIAVCMTDCHTMTCFLENENVETEPPTQEITSSIGIMCWQYTNTGTQTEPLLPTEMSRKADNRFERGQSFKGGSVTVGKPESMHKAAADERKLYQSCENVELSPDVSFAGVQSQVASQKVEERVQSKVIPRLGLSSSMPVNALRIFGTTLK